MSEPDGFGFSESPTRRPQTERFADFLYLRVCSPFIHTATAASNANIDRSRKRRLLVVRVRALPEDEDCTGHACPSSKPVFVGGAQRVPREPGSLSRVDLGIRARVQVVVAHCHPGAGARRLHLHTRRGHDGRVLRLSSRC